MANVHKKIHKSQFKREGNAQNDRRPSAKFSYVRIPVQKTCLVLDTVRGKDVKTTLGILAYNPRYASGVIKKLVKPAIANAENNSNLQTDKLYIVKCHTSNGPIMERVHPRAQGRACRVFRRMSHITVVLDEG